MSPQLKTASVLATAATFAVALFSAQGSGAIAQDSVPAAVTVEPTPLSGSMIATPQLPETPGDAQQTPEASSSEDSPAPTTLAGLVSAQSPLAQLPRELMCLAGAIYFEAQGESLAGQLAVGRVIVARSKSGRFPSSYCGVVYQPSQFSFVRGSAMPAIARGTRGWRDAVAIARIAHSGSWRSQVEGALFFHAARISPGWRLARLGRVDGHVFYR